MKIKIWIISILSIIIVSLSFAFFPSNTKSQIPGKFIGNWINKENSKWEFGFFEDFVIFENGFWEYKEVSNDQNGWVNVVLTKQYTNIHLQLYRNDKNQLIVKENNKERKYILMEKLYPNYPSKDTSSFSPPNFKVDSVTIIGYYRNQEKGIKGFMERFFRSPFEVALSDFITGEEVKYYGDIDNLGRFKITFPVMNTQELYIDWKRTRIRAVVEPRDTLFLFADINDYIPTEDDKKNYESYIDRPKQVLFMGKNARINNELKQYPNPWFAIDRSKMTNLTDMEYLRNCEDVYRKKIKHLDDYIEKHPGTSEKFISYKQKEEKYDFAFNLMQHQYDISGRADSRFQDGYIQYVKENFPLNDELDYTLTRYFNAFLSDYIGYVKGPGTTPIILFNDIGKRLQNEGKLTDDIDKQIKEINDLANKSKTIANKNAIEEELKIRSSKLNTNNLVKQTAEILQTEVSYLNTDVADSLISNLNLRELWTTNRYHYWFEVLRKPLSSQKQLVFRQEVKNAYFRNHIDEIQKHYGDIANEGITYQASLKNTDNLKGHKDADKLFEELIKPYKGKVIYIDFWGTWCGGCRRDLQTVSKLKEEFPMKDVVFVYFANRSPENTWKNLIKEMRLTGENVVHYRLPDEQQAMLERKLGVNVFPTYMLINKEGILVNKKAKSPSNLNGAVQEIKQLL